MKISSVPRNYLPREKPSTKRRYICMTGIAVLPTYNFHGLDTHTRTRDARLYMCWLYMYIIFATYPCTYASVQMRFHRNFKMFLPSRLLKSLKDIRSGWIEKKVKGGSKFAKIDIG